MCIRDRLSRPLARRSRVARASLARRSPQALRAPCPARARSRIFLTSPKPSYVINGVGDAVAHGLISEAAARGEAPIDALARALDDALDVMRREMPRTLVANWRLWPAANVVNFALVPPPLRVLFANIVSLGCGARRERDSTRATASPRMRKTGGSLVHSSPAAAQMERVPHGHHAFLSAARHTPS